MSLFVALIGEQKVLFHKVLHIKDAPYVTSLHHLKAEI